MPDSPRRVRTRNSGPTLHKVFEQDHPRSPKLFPQTDCQLSERLARSTT